MFNTINLLGAGSVSVLFATCLSGYLTCNQEISLTRIFSFVHEYFFLVSELEINGRRSNLAKLDHYFI